MKGGGDQRDIGSLRGKVRLQEIRMSLVSDDEKALLLTELTKLQVDVNVAVFGGMIGSLVEDVEKWQQLYRGQTDRV